MFNPRIRQPCLTCLNSKLRKIHSFSPFLTACISRCIPLRAHDGSRIRTTSVLYMVPKTEAKGQFKTYRLYGTIGLSTRIFVDMVTLPKARSACEWGDILNLGMRPTRPTTNLNTAILDRKFRRHKTVLEQPSF